MRDVTRLLVCAWLLLAGTVPLQAGDLARRAVIGFSPDGSHFAFEEYGVQDGSGFPYSNVFVLDIDRDAWVANSPKQALLKDEAATLQDARVAARRQADPLLRQFDISREGDIVATNLYSHVSADPYRIVFRPRLVAAGIDEPVTLTLETYKLEDRQLCRDVGASDSKGFRLSLAGPDGTRVLHEDTRIPASRTCPLDYRIHDVVTFYPDGGKPAFAVIIQMMQVGFEGPDGRFLAVTGRL